MLLVSTELIPATAGFTGSITVLGSSQVPQITGSTIFRQKGRDFLKLIGTVTALWVL